MWILKHTYIFFVFSGLAALGSIAAIFGLGLNPSVDFSGGSIVEVIYEGERPEVETIQEALIGAGIQGAVVQTVDEQGMIVKTLELSDERKSVLDEALSVSGLYEYEEERYRNLGPTVSDELKNRSIFAIILVVLAIVSFIAYTFRGVSRPVSSFKYGLVAIVALIHDILLPTALFAILGSIFIEYQIDVLFITALLAILGFSVNDTIVVFDRVRENLNNAKEKGVKATGDEFKKIVGQSLEETFRRSLNTSITTLIPLAFLFFIGGEATRPFSLVLALGVIAGTYSSLFLASPLLVLIEKYQKPPKDKKEKDKKKVGDFYDENGVPRIERNKS